MSKEHLFSDWLKGLFPRDASHTHTVGIMDDQPWRLVRRQGHSGTKKIRSVCENCNNGWMSEIDNAAKDVAPQLIRGDRITVTQKMQRTLALWLAKAATVADSRNRKRSVVTKEHRSWLYEQREPPAEWEIWLASYKGDSYRELALFQNSGHLDFTPVSGPGEQFKGYVETTFFGMGAMAALVIADSLPPIDFNIGNFAGIARRIWPISAPFEWPLPHSIDDEEADAAAQILSSMLANFRSE